MSNFINWYIKGKYHCEYCPYSWEDRGEEDADCGCYIYGDIRDTCRLFPPFLHIIGLLRKRKYEFESDHQFDGIVDFYEQEENREQGFEQILKRNGIDKPYDYQLYSDIRDLFIKPKKPLKERCKEIRREKNAQIKIKLRKFIYVLFGLLLR